MPPFRVELDWMAESFWAVEHLLRLSTLCMQDHKHESEGAMYDTDKW